MKFPKNQIQEKSVESQKLLIIKKTKSPQIKSPKNQKNEKKSRYPKTQKTRNIPQIRKIFILMGRVSWVARGGVKDSVILASFRFRKSSFLSQTVIPSSQKVFKLQNFKFLRQLPVVHQRGNIFKRQKVEVSFFRTATLESS